VSSAGRLRSFQENWSTITSDPIVLNAIRGYHIPFSTLPSSRACLLEPNLSLPDALACDKEIERLQQKGAVTLVEPSKDQFLSSFFLIDKLSGGKRFILNLRDLNLHIEPPQIEPSN